MDIELLIASLAFIIPMCFSPGPNNVLCAAHGSQHGFRETLILISGMAFGWSTLGLFVAVATDLIEENQAVFDLLTYVGATYIAYLSYKIATSNTIEKDEEESERLGFLVLMTSFGTLFGTGFTGKVLLVLLNLACGLPAVMTWAAFGTVLRRAFSTPESARVLNRVMGLSLFAVAIWIAMPH